MINELRNKKKVNIILNRTKAVNLVETAINKNEMKFLLEGKKGYKLENDSWSSISAPIDWTRVIPLIYKEYEKNKNVEKMYSKAILDMLKGEAEETYFGIAILYFQTMREETNRSPFKIDRAYFVNLAIKEIKRNKMQLKEIGLWDNIQRYRKLFKLKYDIFI